MKNRLFALVALLALCGSAGAQSWREIIPAEGPTPRPRFNAAAVYEPVAHRMIVIGGRASGRDLNDVWAFDLETSAWTELTPASGPAPSPRSSHNAVYDAEAHRALVWSGQQLDGGRLFLNDVWAFDFATNTWVEFQPPDPKPNIRYGTAAVFDPRARALVNFAGFTDDGRYDDTWAFEPDTERWTDISPADGHPLRRCLHNGIYESRGHRFLIYGGQSGGAAQGDIWAFDLETPGWTELTPSASPDGRWFASTAYDPSGHRVLMFGGEKDGGQGNTDELWVFDLATNAWAPLGAEGVTPRQRSRAASIFIASEGRMLIYGGADGSALSDLWSLEGFPVVTAVEEQDVLPGILGLEQNYPNPFNSGTVIDYAVGQGQNVSLQIHNLVGQRVATLVDEFQAAGSYRAQWSGEDSQGRALASGVYFYRLEAGGQTLLKKLLLLR